jgi:CBS domain-containing membrane protein
MWNLDILKGYKRRAAYTLLWSFAAMLLLGTLASVTWEPFIFPSLGPTALMLFAHPLRRDSSPRHVLVGHALGAGSGYFALAVTGLLSVRFSEHVTPERVLAAAIALGMTAGLTTIFRSEHAPAGATTLIVALGILPRPIDFVALMLGVAMLTLLAAVVNRLFGIAYPWWNPHPLVLQHDAQLIDKLHRRSSQG